MKKRARSPALGGPPGAGSTPSKRNRLPRTGASASAQAAPAARRAPSTQRAPAARAPAVRPSATGRSSAAQGASAASRRSDARISQAICQRLSGPVEDLELADLASERLDASDVRVSVAGGKVTLEGTLPERRMKPYIEALVDASPGVQDIDNRLRVRR